MKTNWCSIPVFVCLLFGANAAVGQQQLPLFPKYQVLGVIYAPPGASSSVSYTNSTQVGSSHSIVSDSSTTTTQTQSNTTGFNLFGFGYSNTSTTSDSWMSAWQNSSSESLQTTTGNGISVNGATSSGLGVLHDNDLISIWLNPVLKTTLLTSVTSGGVTTFPIQWSGFMFNSCDLNATQDPVNFTQLIDGCDPTTFPGPDIVYIPVFCLKNPYWPPNSCSQYLSHTSRFWDLDPWGVDSVTKVPVGPGLTIQDYADILQSDPFVTQTLVANNPQAGENVYTNPCHPAYGINFDPNVQETIPDSTTFAPPFMGKWPAKYCGTPGTAMERFNSFSTAIPYPAPQPNGGTTTSTGFLSSNTINMQGTQATDTHSHSFNESTSLTFAAEVSYGFPSGWTISNLSAGFNFGTTSGSGTSWTDGQTIGKTATQSQMNSASYSVTGPKQSDNWNGPIDYNVYQDTVYGTFAFRDPNRSTSAQLITAGKTSPIGVTFTGSPKFGSVTVGKVSAAITVTLTNNSPNQMTMLSPALSFSDLALDATGTKLVSSFVIVSGSDACSNKVLAAGKTCTLKIHFAPTLNAAPNTVQVSYPVAAYVIASGNELVPVADSGAPAYNELVLVTNTVITVTGSTEAAVTVSGTAVPAPATCTGILPSCDIGATLTPATLTFANNTTSGSQAYTFKNYASTSQTVTGIQLSDTTDYSITSDTCSGATLGSLHTCTFTLLYSAKGVGHIDTKVSVLQTVNGVTTSLAFAGAAASVFTNGMTLSGPGTVSNLFVAPLTVTNTSNGNTLSNMAITVGNETGQPGFWQPALGSCTSLAAGASCTAYINFHPSNCTQGCSGSATITVTGSEAMPVQAQTNVTFLFFP